MTDLTSNEIPPAMVFAWDGEDQLRDIHSAKRSHSVCPTCNVIAEIWEFRLEPIERHPNYLRVHRGKHSCGIHLASVNPMRFDGWTIKEQNH
tara:strand:- start:247 stop:522 length:276 start_codon:yes stop_codon:yes gene_type:complete